MNINTVSTREEENKIAYRMVKRLIYKKGVKRETKPCLMFFNPKHLPFKKGSFVSISYAFVV